MPRRKGVSEKYACHLRDPETGSEFVMGIWVRETRIQFGGPYSFRRAIEREMEEAGFTRRVFEVTEHGDRSRARIKYRVHIDRNDEGRTNVALCALAFYLKRPYVRHSKVTRFRRLMN